MSLTEEIADGLAKRALEVVLEDGDERIVKLMAEAIANTSPTLEEAFLMAVRFRRGEHRALEVLAAHKAREDLPPEPEATTEPPEDAEAPPAG